MPPFFRLCFLLACGFSPCALAQAPPPPARPDVLEPVLAGEFALQAGKLQDAARAYLTAARASGDVGLAERATRIALLADDDVSAEAALALWRKGAPPSLAMTAAGTTLALRGDRRRDALAGAMRLAMDPDPRGWRYALVALSSGGRDTRVAAWVLARLRAAGGLPKDLQVQLAFAGLAQRLQALDLVDALVDDMVRDFPDEPRIQLLRVTLHRENGDLGMARARLDDLRTRLAQFPALRLQVAAEYESLGDVAAAAEVLATGPQDLQTRAMRAAMYARDGDDAGMAGLYRELQPGSQQPEPNQRLLLGQVAEQLKRYDEALRWYDSVPGGDLLPVARLRRAGALHAMGKRDEAFAALRMLQNDDEAADEVVRDAYLAEADLRRQDGDEPAEFDAYARGLAALPDDLAVLYARALAWERVDRVDRAEADLRKLLVVEPDNVAALNALGYILADRTTRYREALELIDRARVADPGNSAIIDSHGWVLYRLGRREEALVQLKRSFALNKDPEVAAHIGEVLWVTGQREEARQWFGEARRLDPENRSLKRALETTGAGR